MSPSARIKTSNPNFRLSADVNDAVKTSNDRSRTITVGDYRMNPFFAGGDAPAESEAKFFLKQSPK